MNKREKKEEWEKKKLKQKKKDKGILIIGIVLVTLAMIQLLMFVIYFVEIKGNNQIIYNDQVVTTEVCTLWFNNSNSQSTTENRPFYYKSQPIPYEVVNDVCNKWKKIKDDLDKNKS